MRMPLCQREEGDCDLGDETGGREPPVISQTSASWIKPFLKLSLLGPQAPTFSPLGFWALTCSPSLVPPTCFPFPSQAA